ncbi:GDSL-like Lipase/Acylhydrolase [Streptomyces sp. YIM 130001]|uniref:SGNH/GDSL hydrolase family protein n=1 Tax=Streptomyces sp. YIM 130001 TaxID=2259644 RepID=UPI000E654E75|nr:SGNH/GDSL hydrolase family protein [Streptomyces sp. YIM 130001]RII17299.1 GDSL-like Lipase/Acylhydrolase [Streptomyces sp. YIM 130001]
MRDAGTGRTRSVLTTVGVVLVGSGVLAAAVLAGCDANGGDDPAPHATSGEARPSPKPTPLWDRSPNSLAAVGDSITRGFDACGVLTDCPEASWATGSESGVRSLAVRLFGEKQAAARSWNYARSGAAMDDLPGQMRRAAARSPDLVTVLMGANDACRSSVSAMTSVKDFKEDFEESLAVLRRQQPKAQVYVSSVPNLKRLWSQGRGNPLGKQVWKLGICPSMLEDADALDADAVERRDAVQRRVIDYNEVLEEVCAGDDRCRYDGGAVFDYRFGTGQLSRWDWFHPSKDGQSRLAEMAFRAVTARKNPAESGA